MIKLSCLCGQSRIEISNRPDFVHECNCRLCRNSGALWGYFHPSEVDVAGETEGYSRTDKDDPAAEMRFCTKCGATTHFVLTPSAQAKFGNVQMGVNLRLADAGDLAGIELRYPDGAGWDGESAFGYLREPHIL